LSEPHYLFPKRYADSVQRLRVGAGFVLLIAFAFLAQPSPRSLLLGMPVALAGLLLRGWAAGHLAKNRELATSGPYAYLRNPLYVGTLVCASGVVIAACNLWLALLFSAVFLLVYLPAIELEEQHLRQLFPEYESYAERVQRFLPVRRWLGGRGRFSWRLYRKNEEFKASAGFLVAAAWLVWKCFGESTL
jgi:protein-S-isoprenylcysteine O-methyltransferase Ste14